MRSTPLPLLGSRKLSSSKPFLTPCRYIHQKAQLIPFAHWPPASFSPCCLFIHPANVSAMLTLRQAARILMMNTSSLTNHICACLWLTSLLVCLSAFQFFGLMSMRTRFFVPTPLTLSAMESSPLRSITAYDSGDKEMLIPSQNMKVLQIPQVSRKVFSSYTVSGLSINKKYFPLNCDHNKSTRQRKPLLF